MNKILFTIMLVVLITPPSFAEDAEKRRQKCHAVLENYFQMEVSENLMRDYLVAQHELTVYRVFVSFLAQRREQNEDITDTVRQTKAATRYSEMIKERIAAIEKTAGNDPKFQEAKRNFSESPLAVATFAKLAPFLEEYISRETGVYDSEETRSLRLDRNDFRMLDVLASTEITSRRTGNFIQRIEDRNESFIRDNELDINIGLMIYEKIRPNLKKMNALMRGEEIAIPAGCLTQMSDEISQAMFNSFLSRADLRYSRERKASQSLYYRGKDSPWGEL